MAHSLVPAAYVLLLRGHPGAEEVLLHLRQNTGYRDGHWALVAGHVEAGETAREAAVREAAEEAGVVVDPVDLEPITVVHRIEVGGPPVEQRVDFFFATRRWSGAPSIREPQKAAEQRWFSVRALPEPGVPQERLVLDAYVRGRLQPLLETTEH
ncbi:ADP-ribose pyrophosphatase YjhB (NUDIX family) [Mumia flava]|uniref:ADP-ribose pyrophosphatase YjhB (NUDIX family) n=1 Tax=Mumia flava TaxID=1348852 RepID=A0A0B2BBF5_9ACTN|nr:NUDIX domain-containing protein [Mumia flava]PJJ56171.1 ADP-ribose pyrophosphatase YjhB (NUDIX family) [Mumia flava]